MLEIQNLVKKYGKFTAVDGLSLRSMKEKYSGLLDRTGQENDYNENYGGL